MGRPLPNYFLNDICLTCCLSEGVVRSCKIKSQIGRNRYIVVDGQTEHTIDLVSLASFNAGAKIGTGVMKVREKTSNVYDKSVSFLTNNLIYLFEDGEETPKTFIYDVVDATEGNFVEGIIQPPEAPYRLYGIPADDDASGTFKLLINSGDDKTISLPTAGYLNGKYQNYDWIINWGDGQASRVYGAGSLTSSIDHTYAETKDYTITIEPFNPSERGWLSAFGFHIGTTNAALDANKAKFKAVDGELSQQAIRTSPTDSYVCAFMFTGCTNLKMATTFKFGKYDVVGEHFAEAMFKGCTALNAINGMAISVDLATIEPHFLKDTFNGCTTLATGVVSFMRGTTGEAFAVSELDKASTFASTFAGCAGITEVISPVTIKLLGQVPTASNGCFTGATVAQIADCPANWK